MRNQSLKVRWKLLEVKKPSQETFVGHSRLISSDQWELGGEGILVSASVWLHLVLGGPLRSPAFTTESPTSFMKHMLFLVGELFLVLCAHYAL